MGLRYRIANGPMPTTASFAPVATGTSIKTMLQFKALVPFKITEWGCSFDGFAAALPGRVELLDTGAVNATVTAAVAADIMPLNALAREFNSPATVMTLGTAATGYTSSAEGTITAVHSFDTQFIAPTNQYIKQWPLGQEDELSITNYVRIRVLFGTGVNMYCYIDVEF